MRVKYGLSACADCLFLVANGETPEGDNGELETAMMANLGAQDVRHLVCGSGEDNEFSWSACECCGSRLGGSRHQLIVLGE